MVILNYFLLFFINLIISPFINYGYLWLFSKKIIIFGYFLPFHLMLLFLVILSYFWLF
jgi:hypothetical protein